MIPNRSGRTLGLGRGRRRSRVRVAPRLGAVVIAAAAVAGCGSGDDADDADGASASGIVATTTIWADIASDVGCGVEVPAIVPAGADPHSFEPSLRDRERLGDATAVIANGSGLEGSLVDMLATVADDGTTVVEMTDHVDVIAGDDEHDEQDDHEHGDADPHVWHDPARVAGALDVVADVMAAAPGVDAAAVEGCAADYRAELEQLDADIAELLAPIPADRRVLVTGHDSLSYFADRYGFEVIGAVIPSTSTIAESSASSLADLADLIEQYDVPAIFTDSLETDVDASALADRLGIDVVPLHTGSLTADGPAATYVGMLRSNAEAIAAALVP